MGLVYLCKVNELRNYRNYNIHFILYKIAFKKDLLKNNEIMYRRLYHEVIIPNFAKYNIPRISYTQYRRLRYIKYGRVPKKAAYYLYGLYEIMRELGITISLSKKDNNFTYTDFTMKKGKTCLEKTKNIFIKEERIGRSKDIKEIIDFLNSLSDLDDLIFEEKNMNKQAEGIYNNLW